MSDQAALLIGALLLDAALGEPRWLWDRVPHPAVLAGRLIAWCDQRFNAGPRQREKGGGLVIALILLGAALGGLITALPWPVELISAAILLAQRSLSDHVADVARALRLSLGDGRLMVARIVGRDVTMLNQAGVARAAIESAAENLSDGVVAPVFWFLIAGLPGLIIYKLINTADSMIGYRTPRHLEFGWAAARLDDLLNWISARLTAVILTALSRAPGKTWAIIRRDAGHHRSPNAGWPEAAMAATLGIRLSGPRVYDGEMTQDPYVNPQGRAEIGPDEIDGAVQILWRCWAVLLLAAFLVWIV